MISTQWHVVYEEHGVGACVCFIIVSFQWW